MKRTISLAVFALCIVFSVASAYNVMVDNPELEKQATEVACRKRGTTCRPATVSHERTPFGQTYGINRGDKTVIVRCRRMLILVGSYDCEASEE